MTMMQEIKCCFDAMKLDPIAQYNIKINQVYCTCGEFVHYCSSFTITQTYLVFRAFSNYFITSPMTSFH